MSDPYFDVSAQRWDTPLRVTRAAQVAAEIDRRLGDARAKRALDFGCGTGLISFGLRHRFDDICLMDASPGMVDALREKLRAEDIHTMRPVLFDPAAERYPETFDCIYSSMVFHHIPDTGGMIVALCALLRPGGWFFLVDLDETVPAFHSRERDFHGHDGFAHADILTQMEAAGLTDCAAETFFHGTKESDGRAIPYSLFIAEGHAPAKYG